MLVRHTLYYLPAQIVSPLVQLGSILIWAHLFTPEHLGIVTLVIAMQELAYVSLFMWWAHYALRHLARFKEQKERIAFIRTEFFAIIVSAFVQSSIVFPIMIWYFPEYMTPGHAGLATAFIAMRSLSQYFAERSRSDVRIALYTLMQTIGPVLGLAIGLLLIRQFGAEPNRVFAGFVVAQAIGLAVAFWRTDFGRAIGRPDRAILKQSFTFGVPVMGSQMLAVVALNAPRFIVNHTLGLAAAGVFAVGYGLGLRASSFAVMLVTAGAYPLVVRKMETEGLQAAYDQLGKNMMLVALAVMPVALGLLAINHSVVDVFVAEHLREVTYVVLPLTTIGGLFRYLRAHTTDQIFLIRSKPNYALIIAVIDLTLAVTSSYVGLSLAGLGGAAAGPAISGVATLIASFVIARFVFDFRMPVVQLLGVLAAAALMLVCIRLLPYTNQVFMLGAYVMIGAVVYSMAVVAFVPNFRRIVQSKLPSLRRRKAKV